MTAEPQAGGAIHDRVSCHCESGKRASMTTIEGDVDLYFSLSYANMLTVPRALLQSMPDEWQQRFYDLMMEYDDHWRGLPDGFCPPSYRVQPVEDGRLQRWSRYRLPHYNRTRTRVSRDGAVTGEGFHG